MQTADARSVRDGYGRAVHDTDDEAQSAHVISGIDIARSAASFVCGRFVASGVSIVGFGNIAHTAIVGVCYDLVHQFRTQTHTVDL